MLPVELQPALTLRFVLVLKVVNHAFALFVRQQNVPYNLQPKEIESFTRCVFFPLIGNGGDMSNPWISTASQSSGVCLIAKYT